MPIPRIHVANMLSMTTDQASTYSTPGYMMSSKPCYDHTAANAGSKVRRIAETRRKAQRAGRHVGMFIKWRADLFTPHVTVLRPEGFDPSWVIRGVDLDSARQVWQEWDAAGWRFTQATEQTDMTAWVEATRAGPGICQFYAHGDPYARQLRIRSMVCDLRNPDYRAFAVAHAERMAKLFSVDGFLMDGKLGWHSHGSPERSTPDRHPHEGGVLFDSPYGPGEYEASLNSLVRELAEREIFVVMISGPPRDAADVDDPWAWADDDVRGLLLGEYTNEVQR